MVDPWGVEPQTGQVPPGSGPYLFPPSERIRLLLHNVLETVLEFDVGPIPSKTNQCTTLWACSHPSAIFPIPIQVIVLNTLNVGQPTNGRFPFALRAQDKDIFGLMGFYSLFGFLQGLSGFFDIRLKFLKFGPAHLRPPVG